MQAVKRFEPEKGFRLATYAIWWIRAAIHEYILRSWSLVRLGSTANQKKLFFNLRKAKSKISALEDGDLHPDQVKLIAKRLGVTEQDVVDMNRRLGGDVSLNAPIREDGDAGEWQDWLVDEAPDQESRFAESEEADNRRQALHEALSVLNVRERRIFGARQLIDDPVTLEDMAVEFGVSRERVRQIEVRALEKVKKAVKECVARIQFHRAASQAVDFGPAIRSVAQSKMTWAAHRYGTGNSVIKENDMTNTTKLIAEPAAAIDLIGSLAFSARTHSRAQPGPAYQTHGK
jgi:RNA polymerase sigma-32 factor